MDAQAALSDLMEISSQIETAVVVAASGEVAAATLRDDASARELARITRELLDLGTDYAGGELAQVEVATRDGSVFVVREGGRLVAATTDRAPTVGLVLYDLRACLRSIEAADGDASA